MKTSVKSILGAVKPDPHDSYVKKSKEVWALKIMITAHPDNWLSLLFANSFLNKSTYKKPGMEK